MSICHDKKLIFIHIPKNAGSSIIKKFDCSQYNDIMDSNWKVYKNFFSDYWESYLKFSIIRDPLDRFISLYNFLYDNSWSHIFLEFDFLNYDVNFFVDHLYLSFDIFCSKIPILSTQSYFIFDYTSQNIVVDKIIKYENLKEDLLSIGISDLEKINTSRKICNIANLTKESKNKIYTLYKEDYNNFEYFIH